MRKTGYSLEEARELAKAWLRDLDGFEGAKIDGNAGPCAGVFYTPELLNSHRYELSILEQRIRDAAASTGADLGPFIFCLDGANRSQGMSCVLLYGWAYDRRSGSFLGFKGVTGGKPSVLAGKVINSIIGLDHKAALGRMDGSFSRQQLFREMQDSPTKGDLEDLKEWIGPDGKPGFPNGGTLWQGEEAKLQFCS